MTYLTVMDFTTSTIWVFPYPANKLTNEIVEKYLERKGFKMSQCSYMTTNNDLEININNKTFSVRSIYNDSTRVKSIEQLMEAATKGQVDIYLWLGGVKSSKSIFFELDLWCVYNDVDGTSKEYSTAAFKRTLIAKMIKEGNVYYY